jgi:hypothetical protein
MVDASITEGSLAAFARSSQALPGVGGAIFVGAGCGIGSLCAGAFPPPQSVMAGVLDPRLGIA